MSAELFDVLVEQMHRAGERLLMALADEERLAALVCTSPDDELLYGEWARLQQRLEECRAEYSEAVVCCNPPKGDFIRHVLETR